MSRITRAQSLSQNKKRDVFFSDFMTSFAKTPVGDQLARVTNERSINQSLKNIILTEIGERLFQPNIGSTITSLLFDNNHNENLSSAEFLLNKSIEANEPRIVLIDVSIDTSYDEQELIINIIYTTINNPEPITFNYILKRVR